jgi:hypothetical protein
MSNCMAGLAQNLFTCFRFCVHNQYGFWGFGRSHTAFCPAYLQVSLQLSSAGSFLALKITSSRPYLISIFRFKSWVAVWDPHGSIFIHAVESGSGPLSIKNKHNLIRTVPSSQNCLGWKYDAIPYMLPYFLANPGQFYLESKCDSMWNKAGTVYASHWKIFNLLDCFILIF